MTSNYLLTIVVFLLITILMTSCFPSSLFLSVTTFCALASRALDSVIFYSVICSFRGNLRPLTGRSVQSKQHIITFTEHGWIVVNV